MRECARFRVLRTSTGAVPLGSPKTRRPAGHVSEQREVRLLASHGLKRAGPARLALAGIKPMGGPRRACMRPSDAPTRITNPAERHRAQKTYRQRRSDTSTDLRRTSQFRAAPHGSAFSHSTEAVKPKPKPYAPRYPATRGRAPGQVPRARAMRRRPLLSLRCRRACGAAPSRRGSSPHTAWSAQPL